MNQERTFNNYSIDPSFSKRALVSWSNKSFESITTRDSLNLNEFSNSTNSKNDWPLGSSTGADWTSEECQSQNQTSESLCQKDDSTRFETSQKYKTEICKNFMIHKKCKFGDRCCFAHGLHELREKSNLNNSYKLKVCKNYQQNGFCRYGQRCQYVHLKNNEVFNEILNTNISKLCSKLNENPEEKLNTLLEGLGSLKNRLPIFVKLSKQK